jgi:hypothetical protein
MYMDAKFTHIQARPDEPPALYELKDGKPDLIQFEFRDGTYSAPKGARWRLFPDRQAEAVFRRFQSADK